jgi:tetratricopeptide (TPR) repeat protein
VVPSSIAPQLALAPSVTPPVLARASERLRELPAFDPAEIGREVGFVRAVRRFVAIPLGVLGVLGMGGAMAAGEVVSAILAGVITVLLQVTLHDDVRLAHALDLVRKGELARARRSLRALARARGHRPEQRQRACVVLGALAYRQGELERARRWIGAAADLERTRQGGDRARRFEVLASEVLLLAMTGATEDACLRLREVPPPPPGDELAALWQVHVTLLCAFVAGQVASVEQQLDEWAPLVRAQDGIGPTAALLGWAFAAAGRHDVAAHWYEHALAHGDETLLRTRYPALASALDSFARASHYARR